ncbi:hypothetical protein K8I28_00975, partial [bacterium]|nr:hypothetical protein [bacterium]
MRKISILAGLALLLLGVVVIGGQYVNTNDAQYAENKAECNYAQDANSASGCCGDKTSNINYSKASCDGSAKNASFAKGACDSQGANASYAKGSCDGSAKNASFAKGECDSQGANASYAKG